MADMGLTEVAATIEEMVSASIQQQLIQDAKLIPLVQNFPVAPGMDMVKIPRAGNFTVDTKAENTSVTPQVLTYATDDLDLDQHKVIQVKLEDIANLQSKPNIVQDIIGRMGRQLALDIDTYIVTQLEATSASAPDHRVAYSNSGTDNNLGKADILLARELLHTQNVPFNQCFIGVSPASESDLLAIDDFVHADKYGSAEGLRNGEIGRLYGAPVIMSNVFNTAKTLVWHPTHVAFAMQQAPRFQTDYIISDLAEIYSLDNLYGAVTMDSGKRGVLLGTAS